VVALARVAIERLELTDLDPEVVLGGGLMRGAPAGLIDEIGQGIRDVAGAAQVRLATNAPIVGAALLGLDELGADGEAVSRATRELQAAFVEIEGNGARPAGGRLVSVGPASQGDGNG
jgi:hypothetical protein